MEKKLSQGTQNELVRVSSNQTVPPPPILPLAITVSNGNSNISATFTFLDLDPLEVLNF